MATTTTSTSMYRQNLHPHNIPRTTSTTTGASGGSSSKSSRPSNTRRKSAPSPLNTSQLSTDPEIMASLVESLAKIAPSPQHTLFFEGPSSDLITGKDGAAYTTSNSPVRDLHLLHPEDAATPPVVRTSKRYSTSGSSLKSTKESFMGKRSSLSTDVPNYIQSYSRRNSAEKEKVPPPPKAILRMSSTEDIRLRNSESHPLQTLKTPTNNMEAIAASPAIAAAVLSVPERRSSYGKGLSPEKMKSKRESRRHSALVSSTSSGLQFATALSTPTSPTQPKHVPRASTSTSNSSLKRQSSLQHSSHPPVTNHRRSSSGRLRRRSSPPTLAPSLQSLNSLDDRASNADSIDDAVEAYLCSPRLSQKLRFPNSGRTISFSEVGDPNGYAVFICVGMGLTRYVTAFYDELALSLGLRLITPDRPGVGESDAIPESERTVLSWPDDILYICQSLKITKFSLLAHSAGAIYALATALRMPGHIRGKIHLLAPWIPPSQLEAIATSQGSPSPAAVPASQRILRALPTPFLKAANSSFMSATSASLTTSLPKTPNKKKNRVSSDKGKLLSTQASGTTGANSTKRYSITSTGVASTTLGSRASFEPRSPTITSIMEQDALNSTDAILAAALSSAAEKERQQSYDERLTHQIWSLATRNANPAVDLLVCLERSRPIGFRYVDINRPVVIHHGTKDTRVPVENVKWLGQTMRRCEVNILQGEGHGLMASASVMGGVLSDIAQEWREWKRAMESRVAAEQKVSNSWSPLATTPEQSEVH
ncbi:hypothetical protein H072_10332 [Dactylellina haptotyla CBS 200.50]|uniref:AB hydrolase-1 domain-containing protein n=1 Tax=Dactylellina haptotyla (strain CBS 200.50) TaxID=1284197 RepID=S7ZZJ1_DACHA|nr:hypothetical protein H072_10332 [Dactylellina haptotyla CBS 200.50]